ncbi:hypothetical protein NAI42_10750, partial [Francisella tularensis subsp. holarctica]|uniref:hypothetical protein n=1 Tax=Francisella tularensis TaxID=263 RepID=UPI002381C94A
TRARENLTITMTKHRKKFGEKQGSVPSRFIDELPETDLYWVGTEIECAETRKQNSKQNI